LGYYTNFSLEAENIGGNPDYDKEVIRQNSPEDLVENLLGQSYLFNTDTKWYDHPEDMKKVSKAYPGVLFTLNGAGEESGDIWRKYYFDGKEQYTEARIEFDAFDLTKLV
jgi:hypothetical protein